MKTIFLKLLLVLLTCTLYLSTAFGQSPEKMSYQAVIRNSSDVLVTNTTVGMQISILQGSASGTAVYVETQTPTTNANGLVSIEIGGGAGFDAIDWANGIYFIKTETDPVGGTNYTITGTSQLLSVPYALHAKTAESVSGGITETDPVFTNWDKDYDDLTNQPDFTGWDTDVSDDFDGDYNNLTNPPDLSAYLTVEVDGSVTNEIQDLNSVLIQDNSANAQIKNVTDPTEAQDAATKAYVDELRSMILDLQAENGVTDTRDGNHYNAVKIGNQIWMAENLAYLPSVVGTSASSQTTPYYYVYDYNGTVVADAKATTNYQTYGVLYNWTAAMDGSVSSTTNPSGVQGVCPTGWHLPSDAEWTELLVYLGGESVAGGKLKETGTTHWNTPNTGATNETGFTALPGGYLSFNSIFSNIGNEGSWWCATENSFSPTQAIWVRMEYDLNDLNISGSFKESGFSVRCVRD